MTTPSHDLPDAHADDRTTAAWARTPRRRRLRHVWRAMTIVGLLLLVAVPVRDLVTARTADQAQAAMARAWSSQVVDVEPAAADRPDGQTGAASDAPAAPSSGDTDAALADDRAIARVEVRRPGAGVLLGGVFFVGEGIEQRQIDRGPSHYPMTAMPGEDGNFAVAGHRTTHGGPFFDLDQLRPGDEVHVTDRAGGESTYRVVAQRVVDPTATWVVDPDPLGTGRPMLTFTTCHPRYSARQRLIVWAELERTGREG